MTKYAGKPFVIDKPAQEIADKFSDLTQLGQYVDMLPAEDREKLGGVSFTPDSISIDTKQIGAMKFVVSERSASGVKFTAPGMPVNLELALGLKSLGIDKTEAECSIDIDLPMIIRPMVGPKLKEGVNMLSEVLEKVLK